MRIQIPPKPPKSHLLLLPHPIPIPCADPADLSDFSPQLSLASVLLRRRAPQCQSPQFSLAAVLPNFKTLDRGRRMSKDGEIDILQKPKNQVEILGKLIQELLSASDGKLVEAKKHYEGIVNLPKRYDY